MFSFLASYNEARWKSKTLKAQGQLLRKTAKSTKQNAETRATALTDAAKKNQRVEAENLMRYRENQRMEIGKVRAATSGNGFTDEGTGDQAEINTREMLDRYIADRAYSASVAMTNAWQAASSTRHQGKVEAMGQNIEADLYDMQAKGVRKAANYSMFAGILGSALGAYQGYTNAQDFNQKLMETNPEAYDLYKLNPYASATMNASLVGGMGYHTTAAFSPFIASYSSEVNNRKNNWGGLLSVLTGNVPYKVPAAGTIFSQLF